MLVAEARLVRESLSRGRVRLWLVQGSPKHPWEWPRRDYAEIGPWMRRLGLISFTKRLTPLGEVVLMLLEEE